MAFIKASVQVLLVCMLARAQDERCADCASDVDDTALLQADFTHKDKALSADASPVIFRKTDATCFLSNAEAQQSLAQADTSVTTTSDCDWNPTSVDDLASKYNEIFGPYGNNRNAASHLWVNFIVQRSECLSHEQLVHMFSGFCAVSGSPLGEPSPSNRFKQNLGLVGGGTKVGYSYHCCWPCFCDEKDNIKVDTKTLKDKSGEEKQYFVEVIGNPCEKSPSACKTQDEEGCIPNEAPGVQCQDGKLKDAILSDGGHPIIGMYFVDDAGLQESVSGDEDPGSGSLNDACAKRKASGGQGGMGTIFVNVAKLNPL